MTERLEKMPRGKGVLIAIDETQGVSMGDVVALAETFQHVQADQDQTGLPDAQKKGIAFVFAGLPSLVDDILNNKVSTFLQRAERHTLAEVPLVETRDAYVDVVESSGKAIDDELALLAAKAAEGHPYMIQLIGYHIGARQTGEGQKRLILSMWMRAFAMRSMRSTRRSARPRITGCVPRSACFSRRWRGMARA